MNKKLVTNTIARCRILLDSSRHENCFQQSETVERAVPTRFMLHHCGSANGGDVGWWWWSWEFCRIDETVEIVAAGECLVVGKHVRDHVMDDRVCMWGGETIMLGTVNPSTPWWWTDSVPRATATLHHIPNVRNTNGSGWCWWWWGLISTLFGRRCLTSIYVSMCVPIQRHLPPIGFGWCRNTRYRAKQPPRGTSERKWKIENEKHKEKMIDTVYDY